VVKLQNIIQKDIFRYYGKIHLSFKEKLFLPIGLRYVILFRKSNSSNTILNYYFRIMLKFFSLITNIQIPHHVKIGSGFYIGHFGTIVVNSKVTIGSNVNISPGVVIGQTNRGAKIGTPVIGNQVWIGSNSVIVGNITIGNNVLIAPLSYVNFSIPDNSIVMGNPARVIKSSLNATNHYITNII
jgi:serine O-acetyltransferase